MAGSGCSPRGRMRSARGPCGCRPLLLLALALAAAALQLCAAAAAADPSADQQPSSSPRPGDPATVSHAQQHMPQDRMRRHGSNGKQRGAKKAAAGPPAAADAAPAAAAAGPPGSKLPRPLLAGAQRQAPPPNTNGVLPFCEPRVGVVCTNTDRPLKFLKTKADPIAFDGTPYGELGGNAQANLVGSATLNGYARSGNAGLSATSSSSLSSPNVLPGAGASLDTKTQTILGRTEVAASDLTTPLPTKVTNTFGQTGVDGTYQATDYVPRLTYMIGANFGSPFGLASNERRRK